MTFSDKNPASPRDQAIASAAASRAMDRMKRLQDKGEVIADPADFINREIEQAFLDIANAQQPTGKSRTDEQR